MTPSRPDARASELPIAAHGPDRRLPPPRGIVIAYAFLAAGLILAGHYFYRYERRSLVEQEQQRLEAVASLKATLLSSWLGERQSDVAVSSRGLAVTMRTLWRDDRDVVQASTLVDRLGYLCRSYGYRSAAILDAAGRVVLASPGGPAAGSSPLPQELLSSAAGQVTRLDFEPAEQGSKWHLRLSSPLRASDREPTHGWLVLVMDPEKWLDDLLTRWPGVSSTAETLLVRGDGDEVVYLAGMRRPPGEGTLRSPLSDPEAVAAAAVRGQEGALDGLDYRRAPVFAWAIPVSGTPWWLVAQISRDEIFARFDRTFVRAAAALVFISVLSLVLGLVVYAGQRRRFSRILERTDERSR